MGEKLAGFKEELTCSICKNLFKEPKTLACLHTFCEGCLSDHIKKRPLDDDPAALDTRQNVPCPLCKQVEVLEAADVSLVKTNRGYKNMVAHLSLEEGVRAECSSSVPNSVIAKCDVCEPPEPAVAFCKTCNNRLCEFCQEAHRRQKNKYKAHKVQSLEDFSSSSEIVTHYTWKCEKHEDVGGSEKLTDVELYCKDCNEMICRECSIIEPHGNHSKFEAVKIINKPEYKPRIEEVEREVKKVQKEFTDFIAEMKELQKGLKEHRDMAKCQIDERLQAIHKQLDREKKELLGKVDGIFEAKSKRLEEQIKELEEIEKEMKDSRKVVNDTLKVGIPAEILFLMTQFIDRMNHLFDKYDPYDRKPRENNILQFNANTEFDLSGALGTVTADPFPPAFTVDELASVHFIKGIETPLTITCRDIIGTPRPIIHEIDVKLQPLPDGNPILGEVKKAVDKGVYEVSLQPVVDGQHELLVSVVVGDNEPVPIKGSPFQLKVARPIVNDIQATNEVIPNSVNVWGIAIKRGVRCGVGDNREDEGREGGGDGGGGGGDGGGGGGGEGEGDGGGEGRGGCAEGGIQQEHNGEDVNDEECDIIAISDIGTNQIAVIFDNNFQEPKWIGEEGNGELQFKSPRGIAFNPKGDIAVVDKGNNRVQVLSVNGEFKFKFGEKGSGNGKFEQPTDIVIDVDGIMYVSDSMNNRIQYFSTKGEFIACFGNSGDLNMPYAMAWDGLGQILITEKVEKSDNSVQLWKPIESEESQEEEQEPFKCVFKSGNFFEPVGIAHHSETDYIIVTEYGKHRLSVLDKKGHPLRQLGKEGTGDNEFKSPMGVGVLSDSRVVVCNCAKNKIMIFHIVAIDT